jgi:hypothetical protein
MRAAQPRDAEADRRDALSRALAELLRGEWQTHGFVRAPFGEGRYEIAADPFPSIRVREHRPVPVLVLDDDPATMGALAVLGADVAAFQAADRWEAMERLPRTSTAFSPGRSTRESFVRSSTVFAATDPPHPRARRALHAVRRARPRPLRLLPRRLRQLRIRLVHPPLPAQRLDRHESRDERAREADDLRPAETRVAPRGVAGLGKRHEHGALPIY